MSTLSIFDAAREAPGALALAGGGGHELCFRELARLVAPRAAALLRAGLPALALAPRADLESLLWLHAAFATGTPVLTLHPRGSAAEHAGAARLAGAAPPPAFDAASAEGLDLPAPGPDRALALIPTSGSSGTPRLVQLSRGAVEASARASAANLGWEPDDAWLLCLPLAHAGGLSIVTRALLARRAVLLFEPREGGILASLDELSALAARATLISLVPSVLDALLDAGFVPGPRLRAVLLGGAACSPALARRAHAARVPLLTSYGLTETASQVVTRRYAERFDALPERDGYVSSGHPLPGIELELQGGVIAVKAPSMATGYAGGAGEALRLDARGFLLTGDLGALGPSGELYVLGRGDDVIVTAGENVDPLEVEAALLELRGITAACVFGTPSARFGQVVTAALVTEDPALLDVATLARLLAGRLGSHKLPRRTLRVQNLPLTASGKLDRRACAAAARAELDSSP